MKLPTLPIGGQVRQLHTGGGAKARATSQTASAVISGINQLGAQVVKQTIDNAENEARLQATSAVTSMHRSIAEERRALSLEYRSPDGPAMDTYEAADNKIVTQAISGAKSNLSERAMRYATESFSQAGGAQFLASRVASFNELAQARANDHIQDLAVGADLDIRQDPEAAFGYLDGISGIFEDIVFKDGLAKKEAIRSFKQGRTTTLIQSLNNSGRFMDVLGLLDDGRYNEFIVDADSVRDAAVGAAQQQQMEVIDEGIKQIQLDPAAGDAMIANAEQIAESYDVGGAYDVNEMQAHIENKSANAQLTAYINFNNPEEARRRIMAGDYTPYLSSDEIGKWLSVTADAESSGRRATLSVGLTRSKDYTVAISNGMTKLDPGVRNELTNIANDPAYSDSERLSADREAFRVEQYENNVAIFGEGATQLSVTDRQTMLDDVEDQLLIDDSESYDGAALRVQMAAQATARLNNLNSEFARDPAAYVAKYNAGVQRSEARLMALMGTLDTPRSREDLPTAFADYMNASRDAQLSGGAHAADINYMPKDSGIVKSFAATLDSVGNMQEKGAVLLQISTAIPEDMRDDFMSELEATDPATGAALNFYSMGLPLEADIALRGAVARADANKSAAKIVKDKDVMESFRSQFGGVPDGLPAGGAGFYETTLLNQYFGLASAAELSSGIVNPDTLRQARDQTFGPTVSIGFSVLSSPATTVSYRRSDTGQMMTADEFSNQLHGLSKGLLTLPDGGFYVGGSPAATDDILRKSNLLVQSNGKYKLRMPNSAIIGTTLTSGVVQNKDGGDYILDLDSMPLLPYKLAIPLHVSGESPRGQL